MAIQNTPQITGRKDTTTTLRDIDGNVILEIGQQQYTVRDTNGAITHRDVSANMQLVCGTLWNPSMMKGGIYVGVCSQCRVPSLFHRSSHGIVALHRAKFCTDCGTLCCPRHRRQDGGDKLWRCLRHHKIQVLKNLGRPIFFERKEG